MLSLSHDMVVTYVNLEEASLHKTRVQSSHSETVQHGERKVSWGSTNSWEVIGNGQLWDAACSMNVILPVCA